MLSDDLLHLMCPQCYWSYSNSFVDQPLFTCIGFINFQLLGKSLVSPNEQLFRDSKKQNKTKQKTHSGFLSLSYSFFLKQLLDWYVNQQENLKFIKLSKIGIFHPIKIFFKIISSSYFYLFHNLWLSGTVDSLNHTD